MNWIEVEIFLLRWVETGRSRLKCVEVVEVGIFLYDRLKLLK